MFYRGQRLMQIVAEASVDNLMATVADWGTFVVELHRVPCTVPQTTKMIDSTHCLRSRCCDMKPTTKCFRRWLGNLKLSETKFGIDHWLNFVMNHLQGNRWPKWVTNFANATLSQRIPIIFEKNNLKKSLFFNETNNNFFLIFLKQQNENILKKYVKKWALRSNL